MKKRTKIGLFLALAYLIDRIFYREKYKKKEANLEMEIKCTPASDYEPIKFENPKEVICPYCNYKFEEMIKRSRKCPQCKKYIYRKKNYGAKSYELITEDQHKMDLEESNQEYRDSLESDSLERLLRYKDAGCKGVKISTSNDSRVCPACARQKGKFYTIEDALKEMPVPCKECTSDYCRCIYIPEV